MFFIIYFVQSQYVTGIYHIQKYLVLLQYLVLCTNWYNKFYSECQVVKQLYIGDHLPRKVLVLSEIFAVYCSDSICFFKNILFIVLIFKVVLVHFFLYISYLKIVSIWFTKIVFL